MFYFCVLTFMYCINIECLVCFFSILEIFVLSVANEFDYLQEIQPVAINYDWVVRNIKTPGQTMRYMLARVTITTKDDICVYDKFIKPESQVIDYMTHFTGITRKNLENGEEISDVKSSVSKIISGKIIVGHCLHRLLRYLELKHPIWNKREIATTKFFIHQFPNSYVYDIESLKSIAHRLLNITIHSGINSSVESAKAAMKIYLTYKMRWDEEMFIKKKCLTCPIAIDCEMVEKEGMPGNNDMLARVSLVDINGTCIYDKYVLPTHAITDYRTYVSGINESKLKTGVPLKLVQKEVKEIVRGKILVGHDLPKDLFLLDLYHHPFHLKRDTSLFTRFGYLRRPRLRDLAREFLGITIQNRAHCSIQDAKACMELYKLFKSEWDSELYENELKLIDERDLTYFNPGYESPIVTVVCSFRPGLTKAERLHRVSIVDLNLVCIYDKFVSESKEETCERYNVVRQEFDFLIRRKIIVGFNLRSIFSALHTTATLINRRDVLQFIKFKNVSTEVTITDLFNQFLPEYMDNNTTLNSVDEAKKLMALYLKYQEDWDNCVKNEYSKQFETTYNVYLDKAVAISSLILNVSRISLLIRVSIVDVSEQCIYDVYIEVPHYHLKNIETKLVNSTYQQLKFGHPIENVKQEIREIVTDKILIGHCLRTTLKLLQIQKPWWLLRDASLFSKFKISTDEPSLPLNDIFKLGLNLNVTVDYDTVKTAKLLMQLYKNSKNEWDEEIKKKLLGNKLDETTKKPFLRI